MLEKCKKSISRTYQGRILLSFCLVLFFSLSHQAHSKVDEARLQFCQELVFARSKVVTAPSHYSKNISNLRSCSQSLAKLYDPGLFAREGVGLPEDSCGHLDISSFKVSFSPGCHWRKTKNFVGLNALAGKGTYKSYILKEFSEEAKQRFAEYHPGGIESVIDKSYEDFRRNKPLFQLTGYGALKAILKDLAVKLIPAEYESLGFSKNDKMDLAIIKDRTSRYRLSLSHCLEKSDSMAQVLACVDLVKLYAAAEIGADVLDKNIQKEFVEQIEDGNRDAFVDEVRQEYGGCMALYYFNHPEESDPLVRAKACVFSSLIYGFQSVIDRAIENHLGGDLSIEKESLKPELSFGPKIKKIEKSEWSWSSLIPSFGFSKEKDKTVEKKKVVEGLGTQAIVKMRNEILNSCQAAEIFSPNQHSQVFYHQLSKMEQKPFVEKIKRCRDRAQEVLVKKVLRHSIVSRPSLSQFYGSQVNEFANKVFETHYPVCIKNLEKAGREPGPEKCRNYLFSATVFDFMEDRMEQTSTEKLQDLFKNEYKQEQKDHIVGEGQKITNQCRSLIEEKAIKKDLTQEQLELDITSCIRTSVVRVGEETVRLLVPHEIRNHPALVNFNIDLDESVLKVIREDFGQCFHDGIAPARDLLAFEKLMDSALDHCEVESYKDVLFFVLDEVILDKLTEVGMTVQVAQKIRDDYAKKENSLYNKVKMQVTKQGVIAQTQKAYAKVVEDLAPSIVGYMIRENTGKMLMSGEFKQINSEVTASFLACFQNQSIEICQDQAFPKAVELILKKLVPRLAAEKFNEKTGNLFTETQKSFLWVRKHIEQGMSRPAGVKLVKYVTAQLQANKKITSIQKSKKFLESIYEMLVDDHNFITYKGKNNSRFNKKSLVQKMMFLKIQPELNKVLKKFGLLFKREALLWNFIGEQPEGQPLVKEFKSYIYQSVVENKKLPQNVEALFEPKVKSAVQSINRRLKAKK